MTRARRIFWTSTLLGLTAGATLFASACEKTETWSAKTSPGAAGASTGGAAGSSGGVVGGAAGAAGGTSTDYGAYQTVSRAELVSAIGQCTLGVYADFATAADALDGAAKAADAASGDAAALAALRTAYRSALEAWGEAEVFGFGPLGGGPGSAAPTPGGKDLATSIYGWPLVSRCEIEKALASKSYAAPGFVDASLVTARTLGALDFLAFYEGADQSCGGSLSAAWGQIPAGELPLRRLGYAAVVAKDVKTRGRALSDLWAKETGNFVGELQSAGKGSALFPTEQSALNAVSDALFVVDLRVKDRKLGLPLGLVDCTKPTCPEGVESQWAGHSRESIRRNILGFRRIATGCGPGGSGVGFDDLLHSLGQDAAADELRARVAAVFVALDAVTHPNLVDALATEPQRVVAVRDAVRALTAYLKSDFLTLLDLEPPKILEGDND